MIWSIFFNKEITYDLVSNPSHATARVLEFLPESVGSHDDSHTVICESAVIEEDVLTLLEQDGINIRDFNNFNERNFVADILSNHFEKSLKNMKFNF